MRERKREREREREREGGRESRPANTYYSISTPMTAPRRSSAVEETRICGIAFCQMRDDVNDSGAQ